MLAVMLFLVCSVGAFVSVLIAAFKNRHGFFWMLMGAIAPLPSAIVLLCLPSIKPLSTLPLPPKPAR